ncbi:TIGR04222 domain-containing membrane protein [Streptomyces sp. R302]|uniref:TIGR04222 domain-containing membrane protein n=1 Tax=unclassified Streptomyces TaxID=2593676 RepID=UPI00145FBADE|nr:MULTISPECIES: TIGR04222 domain-containing membrane protein [unclassified Streptomyces]NML51151.1 TIGR04222 domain-containing membrane protein [Streptomyces sp. R301]NML79729.1 TIGR04222 domain-containing membrane protein [Streptomyces sp. R302]
MDPFLLALHLVAFVLLARLWVLARRTRLGPGGPVMDVYEAAFLGGGPGRVADTALAAMHLDGRIVIGGPGVVAVVHRIAHDPVERAVLDVHAAAPSGALHQLRLGVMTHPAVQEIGDGLAARGLVTLPGPRRAVRRWCVGLMLGAFLLFPLGIVGTVTGFALDGPSVPFFVKILPLFFVCFATALVCGSAYSRQVSPAGTAALAAYRREHGTGGVHAVALGGIRALSDRELWERLRDASRDGRMLSGGRSGTSSRSSYSSHSSHSSHSTAGAAVVMWCAGADMGGGDGWGSDSGSGSGSGGGSGCGSGGSSCSSSSSSCSSSSSSCSSSSSSCGSSSSSSCGSSG